MYEAFCRHFSRILEHSDDLMALFASLIKEQESDEIEVDTVRYQEIMALCGGSWNTLKQVLMSTVVASDSKNSLYTTVATSVSKDGNKMTIVFSPLFMSAVANK